MLGGVAGPGAPDGVGDGIVWPKATVESAVDPQSRAAKETSAEQRARETCIQVSRDEQRTSEL
jgi:hypothetical protein